ncbi:hypothetical protein M501DRAFT_167195 [Patellaria atrata CBS 101060]|uniref:Uncharacterized protein n=1 Tax=Patellaria atrata CBS 101060 TaxID=1346257 RepID=A0A9P4S7J3_9PEZI|nr:hypothetical protein M501DRAFT_167195 [Patellaria atrata CBS 101060]
MLDQKPLEELPWQKALNHPKYRELELQLTQWVKETKAGHNLRLFDFISKALSDDELKDVLENLRRRFSLQFKMTLSPAKQSIDYKGILVEEQHSSLKKQGQIRRECIGHIKTYMKAIGILEKIIAESDNQIAGLQEIIADLQKRLKAAEESAGDGTIRDRKFKGSVETRESRVEAKISDLQSRNKKLEKALQSKDAKIVILEAKLNAQEEKSVAPKSKGTGGGAEKGEFNLDEQVDAFFVMSDNILSHVNGRK